MHLAASVAEEALSFEAQRKQAWPRGWRTVLAESDLFAVIPNGLRHNFGCQRARPMGSYSDWTLSF
jgi:hypothetical protein